MISSLRGYPTSEPTSDHLGTSKTLGRAMEGPSLKSLNFNTVGAMHFPENFRRSEPIDSMGLHSTSV